jgi:hypothetical protein
MAVLLIEPPAGRKTATVAIYDKRRDDNEEL